MLWVTSGEVCLRLGVERQFIHSNKEEENIGLTERQVDNVVATCRGFLWLSLILHKIEMKV